MLKSKDFISIELQKSLFVDDSLQPNEEQQPAENTILKEFATSLLASYTCCNNGKPLFQAIQDDWNLFHAETAQQNTADLCALASSTLSTNDKVGYVNKVIEVLKEWDDLKNAIRTDSRFLVESIIPNTLQLDKYLSDAVEVYKCSPKTRFYRARLPKIKGEKFKTKDMGMPPMENAIVGRANPEGISYLYVCTEPQTCLYEVRAGLTDSVFIGTYKIKLEEELSIVNLSAHNLGLELTSDSNAIELLRERMLLNQIGKDLSTPMHRHDNPAIEYIPTQFICEYIRKKLGVDGISFTSSQTKEGTNLVLFNMEKVKCTKTKQVEITNITLEYE